MVFTYQLTIYVAFCLLFIYYSCLEYNKSYQIEVGGPLQSKLNHASSTSHVHYIPFYYVTTTVLEHSIGAIDIDYYNLITFLLISYFTAELAFYYRWKHLERHINNNISMLDVNPNITNQRKDHILKMAAKYAEIYDLKMKGWGSFWFKDCDFNQIFYDNCLEFLNWAFFIGQPPITTKDKKFRQTFTTFAMKCIEGFCDTKFPKGYNKNISFVHNTNDNRPISVTYRPLIFYIALMIGQWGTDFIFIYIMKYKYEYINDLKIWYKLQSPKYSVRSKPILLVHGLGVHYMPYIPLIYKIYKQSKHNDIFCVEIPWTAMSLWHFIPSSIWSIFSNKPSPSYIDSKLPVKIDKFVDIMQQLEYMISTKNTRRQYKFQWTLIGHSYGSFIVSAIYHYIKNRALDRKTQRKSKSSMNLRVNVNDINLPRLILIDPVSMCLTHPVTVSFLDIPGKDWKTCFIQHLAAKELMIACTLSKYFHWFEYVMYPEDLINNEVEHVVICSENDTLVPNKLIKDGLEYLNKEKKKYKKHKKIHLVTFENVFHAAWLFNPSCVRRIVQSI